MYLFYLFILLIIGFILLIKGADLFIEAASSLALKMKVSQIVIGLTIVAFGTSAPELVINAFAATADKTDLSFGNIIGSNIINILLILGVAGILRPLRTLKNTVWREIPFALLAALVIWVMVNDSFFDGTFNILSRGDGIILLLFFLIFLTYSFAIAKVEVQDSPDLKIFSKYKIIIYLILGLTGLFIGGQLAVNNAVKIAGLLGLSDKLIGLTIVALGTSLPELVTSAVAARKGKTDIAIGNIIGSNIFNVFLILGLTAIITPLPFQAIMNYDIAVLVLASSLLFFTMFTGKKRLLDRWEAILFLILYFIYTIYLIMRN
jgi:cation:H+ antiporter